ncbi:hypothetical protein HMPREF1980_01309 [Actinomyces sp. oral taxon 172 str. F0311]|nr:hypothetical protein HMPREF1980_01309 [Actinomyces sp. oral taxon 172 str. F0311]
MRPVQVGASGNCMRVVEGCCARVLREGVARGRCAGVARVARRRGARRGLTRVRGSFVLVRSSRAC